MHSNKLACRVCGMLQLDPPWGDDGRTPNYDICPCCGVEFGYEDSTLESIRKYRNRWLANGANWTEKLEKPNNWDLKKQLENIPDEFN